MQQFRKLEPILVKKRMLLSVAIQDLADALIHRREGRTVHGHT